MRIWSPSGPASGARFQPASGGAAAPWDPGPPGVPEAAPSFKFQVSDCKFHHSEFKFQTSDSSLQTSKFKIQDSDIKFQISNMKHQTSNFPNQISSLRLQTSNLDFKFQIQESTRKLQIVKFSDHQLPKAQIIRWSDCQIPRIPDYQLHRNMLEIWIWSGTTNMQRHRSNTFYMYLTWSELIWSGPKWFGIAYKS